MNTNNKKKITAVENLVLPTIHFFAFIYRIESRYFPIYAQEHLLKSNLVRKMCNFMFFIPNEIMCHLYFFGIPLQIYKPFQLVGESKYKITQYTYPLYIGIVIANKII